MIRGTAIWEMTNGALPVLGRVGKQEVSRTGRNALPEFGRARSVMRARARDAGRHGEEERGHSANEWRADGTNSICLTTRATVPAITPIMIVPITLDPLR